MPVYEYECSQHGVFDAMHSMQDATAPERCPSCGASAPRILSAPHLACIGSHERIARDRNERSRHEPRLAKQTPCPPTLERPALRSSHGSRPWVLEHG